jgi:hypothetical protein
LVSCGHCIVYPSIYGFWLLLWYLVAIVLSILLFTGSDYSFGILWSLHCLSFYLRVLITPLVSFGHCIVYPSIYGFWLLLWYLQLFLNKTAYVGTFKLKKNLIHRTTDYSAEVIVRQQRSKKKQWRTRILKRYIMFGRGTCEKYQSRDEQFPEPIGNLVSRLVFF